MAFMEPATFYKKEGETPLAALERFRAAHPELASAPLTYAGRLDPMAEGLLLILSGDACRDKESYLGLDKTYEFEVLFGAATDSYDVLGVVSGVSDVSVPDADAIDAAVRACIGEREEPYPPFSSKPARLRAARGQAGGKPLFAWAREGKIGEVAVPARRIEVKKLSLQGARTIAGAELLSSAEERIGRIEGDFRQEEIAASWRSALLGREAALFPVLSFRADVSSGTYIRTLAVRIGALLGAPALAFSIKRTRVGPYSL